MRIAELADRVGVPVSTVRYYERIGLLVDPVRTPGGYRDYDEAAADRLLFVTRARRMGLSCDQIIELVPIWGGSNCSGAHAEVVQLVRAKRREVAASIRELQQLAAQLDQVRAALEAEPPPPACRTDLSCCMPEPLPEQQLLTLLPTRPAAARSGAVSPGQRPRTPGPRSGGAGPVRG